MLFITVIQEYISLSERFQQLESNIQVSLDTAIKTAVGSEELFTDTSKWNFSTLKDSSILSVGKTGDTGMLYYFKDDYTFRKVNAYVLAMYYSQEGQFPHRVDFYKNYLSQLTGNASVDTETSNLTDAIYSYLYVKGGVAKRNDIKNQVYGLRPNDDLQLFYDTIGADLTSRTYARFMTNKSPYRFKMDTYEFPILWNMGLDFKGGSKKSSLANAYPDVDLAYSGSKIATNNWGVVKHVGKRISASNTVTKRVYYLTPSSLGVTYIPPTVLRTSFVANLDTLIRLQKISGGALTQDKSSKDYRDTMDEASGCVPTSVYLSSKTPLHHVVRSGGYADELIVNDGNIEYDLGTAQVKVDYSTVDFYDVSSSAYDNYTKSLLAGRLYGFNFSSDPSAKTTQEWRNSTLASLKENDTRKNTRDLFDESLDGKRVVARVTCKIKIHAVYNSSILQWLCYMDYSSGSDEHYDVKLYDPSTNSGKHGFIRNSDGLWYTYTTYYMTTR